MNGLNMQYNHSARYYSAIKSHEVLTGDAAWMSLENVMLRERNQT